MSIQHKGGDGQCSGPRHPVHKKEAAHPGRAPLRRGRVNLEWKNAIVEGGERPREDAGSTCAHCDAYILKRDYANSTAKQNNKWRWENKHKKHKDIENAAWAEKARSPRAIGRMDDGGRGPRGVATEASLRDG